MQITEMARKYGLSADTLRYYERIGLIPPVNRSVGGIREYSEEDRKWVEFITCMRNAGLPIAFLIEYVHLFQQGSGTKDRRKAMLIEQRDLLVEKMDTLKSTISLLDNKIEHYDSMLVKREEELVAEE